MSVHLTSVKSTETCKRDIATTPNSYASHVH